MRMEPKDIEFENTIGKLGDGNNKSPSPRKRRKEEACNDLHIERNHKQPYNSQKTPQDHGEDEKMIVTRWGHRFKLSKKFAEERKNAREKALAQSQKREQEKKRHVVREKRYKTKSPTRRTNGNSFAV
ncbi:hypothetical protein RUND412_009828 [Rhizina undulata]